MFYVSDIFLTVILKVYCSFLAFRNDFSLIVCCYATTCGLYLADNQWFFPCVLYFVTQFQYITGCYRVVMSHCIVDYDTGRFKLRTTSIIND